jgi:hypothetical protein
LKLLNRNRDHPLLEHSPYGRLLLEWEADKVKSYKWKDAFDYEMGLALKLVIEGVRILAAENTPSPVAIRLSNMATPNGISTATPTPAQPKNLIANHPPPIQYRNEGPELRYPVGHRSTYSVPAAFFNGYGVSYNYQHPTMASPSTSIHPPSGPRGPIHQQALQNGRGVVQGVPPAYMG